VFDRYNIVSERDLQEAARKLDNYIEGVKRGDSEQDLGTLSGTPEQRKEKSRQEGKSKLLI
jgi:hypothetical protein